MYRKHRRDIPAPSTIGDGSSDEDEPSVDELLRLIVESPTVEERRRYLDMYVSMTNDRVRAETLVAYKLNTKYRQTPRRRVYHM